MSATHARPPRITITLCDECRRRVLDAPAFMVDGFAQLHGLCPEDGGKVSQVIRILLQPGAHIIGAPIR